MSYLLIDKKIADYKTGKNKNEDIYMFAYITLCDKERTGEVYAREDTLSQNTGIPLRTVQSIISRLKLNPDLMQIETKQLGYDKRKNYYTFNRNPDNYYFLDTRYFYLDIPIAIRGFTMRLKAICKNGTNKIITSKGRNGEVNISQIAKALHHDRETAKTYLEASEKAGLIKKIPNGYMIINNYFLLNLGKGKKDKVYNIIYQFCIDKGAIPPERNDTIIDKGDKHIVRNPILSCISARFNLSDDDLTNLPDSPTRQQFINKHHLLTALNQRCRALPEQLSLEYFLKVLNVENPTMGKNETSEMQLTL